MSEIFSWPDSVRECSAGGILPECRSMLEKEVALFRELIYGYYLEKGRKLPWRETNDPYAIVVSEIMLQQTQVDRVRGKYGSFLEAFPDFAALAGASLQSVLSLWQGLGYNRRAVSLKKIAAKVMEEYGGELPCDPAVLLSFPGIGKATAASICTFAWNQALPFIETNVRTVYIHFFFHGRSEVSDGELMPLVESTLDRENARIWYYALMDYGVYLKKLIPNPGRKSAHYRKQSPFEGSNRKIRGSIVRLMTQGGQKSAAEVAEVLNRETGVIEKNLLALVAEGFLKIIEDRFEVSDGLC